MTKIANATFKGAKGEYSFEVYPANQTFNSVGAVYIFTKRVVGADGKGTHTLLYIGETGDLSARIPAHEKWPCAKRNGVNCICVHRDDGERSRLLKEADLRAGNTTPCNEQ